MSALILRAVPLKRFRLRTTLSLPLPSPARGEGELVRFALLRVGQ